MVSDLRLVVFGGEALDLPSLSPWLERHGEERPLLINMYGITETTVHTTWRRLRQSDLARPGSAVGRPLSDLALHLLDRGGRPVPAGVPGEIHVGGAGVARGYLARPALTAERFVPDPFAGGNIGGGGGGLRLYRSGDLARWRADGDLEYLGRIDRQVKVRGYRIELGEIEAALAEHPGVREAAVMAREDRPGDVRLVGYVSSVAGVAAAQPDPLPQALAAFLAERLPGYMVPAAWVLLDRLPLTPNGKVDRAALPAPEERGGGGAYLAPRSPAEEVLAGIWEEVLERQRVGVEDDFFALGGHSLVAAQVTSRVLKAFSVELPLRALFERPTVAALAVEVERLRGSGATAGAPPLVRAPRGTEAPLSFTQERLWFFDQFSPGTAVYNVPLALALRGALSVPALAAALAAEVDRQEALRTRFVSVGGRPLQRVDPPWRPPLPLVDLRGLPPAVVGREIEHLVAVERTLPFDLSRGRLLRAVLLRREEEAFVLLLTFHHIMSDGWSMRVLARELTALYGAALAGLPSPLPELPLQFRDFAIWQRAWLQGEALERLLGAAVTRLAGVPHLDLPLDRPPEAGRYWMGVSGASPFRSGNLQLELDVAIDRQLERPLAPPGGEPLHDAPRRLHGPPAPAHRPGRLRGLGCHRGPDPRRFRAALRLLHQHPGHPRRGGGRPRLRRAPQTDAQGDPRRLRPPGPAVLVPRRGAPRGAAGGATPLRCLLPLATAEARDRGPRRRGRAVPGRGGRGRDRLHPRPRPGRGRQPPDGEPLLQSGALRPHDGPALAGTFRGAPGGRGGGPGAAAHRAAAPLRGRTPSGDGRGVVGEAVRLDGGPAPIGIWGEPADTASVAGAPAGRRARFLADGTVEASAPAPAGPAETKAAPAPAARELGEPARSLESLSPAKRKLLAKRIRGEAGSGGAPAGARREPALLVDLRPELPAAAAKRPPFFCVHAIGGAVLSYRELARLMGGEQPFYGIQAAGLAGGRAVDDLPAMAAQYAAAVEAVAPHGPYLLGGWSFGGVVAFEMARQMRQRGRPVALVALLDSWAPAFMPSLAFERHAREDDLVRLYLRDQAGLQGLDASWLDGEPPGMGEAAALDWLLARAHETGLLRASLSSAQVRPLLDVYRANVRAYSSYRAYRPRPGDDRLTLFRPRASLEPTNGWSAYASEPVEIHEMAADHYSMLMPPAVAGLADRLRSCIERALDADGRPVAADGPPVAFVPEAPEVRS